MIVGLASLKYVGQARNLARVDVTVLRMLQSEAEFFLWKPQIFLVRPSTDLNETPILLRVLPFVSWFPWWLACW